MTHRSQAGILMGGALILAGSLVADVARADDLKLTARHRVKQDDGGYRVEHTAVDWRPAETAIVICDMWDQHWCRGATGRVGEMAPRMNRVVDAARRRGVLIIHAPSSCLGAYEDTPMRRLAAQAPPVSTEIPLKGWCHLDNEREAGLPIDDSDGGCDCEPRCPGGSPWKRQIAAIDIKEGDAVTDNAEAYYLMKQRGIKNVIVMGVHTNMCVLGRPFSIRQMNYQGQNVVLMRDMTDSMYNSRKSPHVAHVRGTELVVEHIEKFWCPTITSTELIDGPQFRFAEDKRPHVTILVNDNHYDSDRSLLNYAHRLEQEFGFYVTLDKADAERGFAGTTELETSDLAILYARRGALTVAQRQQIRDYLKAGKPLVALRTASHAFGARGDLPPGFTAWPEFDAEVLGGNYNGHYADGCRIAVRDEAATHAILAGLPSHEWTSAGSLYKTAPVSDDATILLEGTSGDHPAEPVAWIRTSGKARIFYTALGHPDDFAEPHFQKLLDNAVAWSLGRAAAPRAPSEN